MVVYVVQSSNSWRPELFTRWEDAWARYSFLCAMIAEDCVTVMNKRVGTSHYCVGKGSTGQSYEHSACIHAETVNESAVVLC